MGHTHLTLSHYIDTLQRLKDKESHNFFFFIFFLF